MEKNTRKKKQIIETPKNDSDNKEVLNKNSINTESTISASHNVNNSEIVSSQKKDLFSKSFGKQVFFLVLLFQLFWNYNFYNYICCSWRNNYRSYYLGNCCFSMRNR